MYVIGIKEFKSSKKCSFKILIDKKIKNNIFFCKIRNRLFGIINTFCTNIY